MFMEAPPGLDREEDVRMVGSVGQPSRFVLCLFPRLRDVRNGPLNPLLSIIHVVPYGPTCSQTSLFVQEPNPYNPSDLHPAALAKHTSILKHRCVAELPRRSLVGTSQTMAEDNLAVTMEAMFQSNLCPPHPNFPLSGRRGGAGVL